MPPKKGWKAAAAAAAAAAAEEAPAPPPPPAAPAPATDTDTSGGVAEAAAAPATGAAAPLPASARLVLYTGDSPYQLARMYDEYSVVCLEGDAFALSPDEWFAVALEVDGARVPFLKSEHVTMRIFDERDPDEGVAQLFCSTSTAPFKKDGLHYFRAVDWRQVGEYRVTFRLTNSRRCDAMLAARTAAYEAAATAAAASSAQQQPLPRRPAPWVQLEYSVVVTDPDYEAQLAKLLSAEVEAVIERERAEREAAAGYPLAPLTKRERAWLEDAGRGYLRRDPSHAELTALAATMARALGTPSPKDPSVLVPVFESDGARATRLALERAHRDALKSQRVTAMQQLIRTVGNKGLAAATSAGSAAAAAGAGAGAGSSSSSSSAAAAAGGGERRLDARAVMASFLREHGGSAAAAGAGGAADGAGAGAGSSSAAAAEGGAGARPLLQGDDDDAFLYNGGGGDDGDDGTSPLVPSPSPTGANGQSPELAAAMAAAAGCSRRCRYKRGELIPGPGWGVYAPWHMADAARYAGAARTQRAWVVAIEAERRAQLLSGNGASDSAADGAGAGGSKRASSSSKLRSDKLITPGSLRLHRYEALPAGVTMVVWSRRELPAAVRRAWGAPAGTALAHTQLSSWKAMRKLLRPSAAAAAAGGGAGGGASPPPSPAPAAAAAGAAKRRRTAATSFTIDDDASSVDASQRGGRGAGAGAALPGSPRRPTLAGVPSSPATSPSAGDAGSSLVVDGRRLQELRAALGFAAPPVTPSPAAAAAGSRSSTGDDGLSYPLSPAESWQLFLACFNDGGASRDDAAWVQLSRLLHSVPEPTSLLDEAAAAGGVHGGGRGAGGAAATGGNYSLGQYTLAAAAAQANAAAGASATSRKRKRSGDGGSDSPAPSTAVDAGLVALLHAVRAGALGGSSVSARVPARDLAGALPRPTRAWLQQLAALAGASAAIGGGARGGGAGAGRDGYEITPHLTLETQLRRERAAAKAAAAAAAAAAPAAGGAPAPVQS